MQIDIEPGDAAWSEAEPLFNIVWSPEIMAGLSWRHIVWAHAQERILVREAPHGLVCHVGLYRRDGLWDGRGVSIGGVGGVATDPGQRRRGYASAAMARAARHMAEAGCDFGLLFCEPHNYGLYEGLGWRRFSGEVLTEQPQGRIRFTAMAAYVLDLRLKPSDGLIDLLGYPW
jgi:aminoglycoside 2'-N-acetyltransferase I